VAQSSLEELIITDSIPFRADPSTDKITVLSIAPLVGEAIRRNHYGESISELFV
jgi:ribose-phosphate pyrophosphokinase